MDPDEVTHESVIQSLIFSIDSCIHQNYFSFYYALSTFNTFGNVLRLLPTPQQIIAGDPEKHIEVIDTILEYRRQHKPGFDIPRFLRLRLKRTKHFLTSKTYFLEELEEVRQEYLQELEEKNLPELGQATIQGDQHNNYNDHTRLTCVASASPQPLLNLQTSEIPFTSDYSHPSSFTVNQYNSSPKSVCQRSNSSCIESPILSPNLWPNSKFPGSQPTLTLPDLHHQALEGEQNTYQGFDTSIQEHIIQNVDNLKPRSQDLPLPSSEQGLVPKESTHTNNQPTNSSTSTSTTSRSKTLTDVSDKPEIPVSVNEKNNDNLLRRRRSLVGPPTYFQPVSVYESIVLEGLMHAIQIAENPFTQEGEIANNVWEYAFDTWVCIRTITNNEIGDLQTFKDWYRHKLHVFRIINYGKTVPDWQWISKEYRLSATDEQINKFARKKTYRRQAFMPFPLGPRFEELDALFPSTSKYNPLAYMRGYYKMHPHSNSNLPATVATNDATVDSENDKLQHDEDLDTNEKVIGNGVPQKSSIAISETNGESNGGDVKAFQQNPEISNKTIKQVPNIVSVPTDTSANEASIASDNNDAVPTIEAQKTPKSMLNLAYKSADNNNDLDTTAAETLIVGTSKDRSNVAEKPIDLSVEASTALINGTTSHADRNGSLSDQIVDKDLMVGVNGLVEQEDDSDDDEDDENLISDDCSLEYYGIELSDDDMIEDNDEDNSTDATYHEPTFFRKSQRKKKDQMLFDISSPSSFITDQVHTPLHANSSLPSVIFEDPTEEQAPSPAVSTVPSKSLYRFRLDTPIMKFLKYSPLAIDTTIGGQFRSRESGSGTSTAWSESYAAHLRHDSYSGPLATVHPSSEKTSAKGSIALPIETINSESPITRISKLPTGFSPSQKKNTSPNGNTNSPFERQSISTSSSSSAPTSNTFTSGASTSTAATSSLSESNSQDLSCSEKHLSDSDVEANDDNDTIREQTTNSNKSEVPRPHQQKYHKKYPYTSALSFFDEILIKHGNVSDAQLDSIHSYIVKTPHVMLIIFDSYHDIRALLLVAKTILRLEKTSPKNFLHETKTSNKDNNDDEGGNSFSSDEDSGDPKDISLKREPGQLNDLRNGGEDKNIHNNFPKIPNGEASVLHNTTSLNQQQDVPLEELDKEEDYDNDDVIIVKVQTRANQPVLKNVELGGENNKELELLDKKLQSTVQKSNQSDSRRPSLPTHIPNVHTYHKASSIISLLSASDLSEASIEDREAYKSSTHQNDHYKSSTKYSSEKNDASKVGLCITTDAPSSTSEGFVSEVSEVSDISYESGGFCYSDCDCGSRCDDSQCSCRNYSLQNFDDSSASERSVPIERATPRSHARHASDARAFDNGFHKQQRQFCGEGQAHGEGVDNNDYEQNEEERSEWVDTKKYRNLLQMPHDTPSQQHLLDSDYHLDSRVRYNGEALDHNVQGAQGYGQQIPRSQPSSHSLRQNVNREHQQGFEHLKVENAQPRWQYQQVWNYRPTDSQVLEFVPEHYSNQAGQYFENQYTNGNPRGIMNGSANAPSFGPNSTLKTGASLSEVESATESLYNILETVPGYGCVPVSRNSSTNSKGPNNNKAGVSPGAFYSGCYNSSPFMSANSVNNRTVDISRSDSNKSAISTVSRTSLNSGQSAARVITTGNRND